MVSLADFGTDLPAAERRVLVRERVATGSACGAMSSTVLAGAVRAVDPAGIAVSVAGRAVQLEALMEPTVRRMTARLAELETLTVVVDDAAVFAAASVTVVCMFRDGAGAFGVTVDVDSVAKHFVLFGE